MPVYQRGDFVKIEFKDESTGESEWMWVRVVRADEKNELIFGQVDNEPIVHKDLRRGMELAVSYKNIRDHKKAEDFDNRK